MSDCIIQIQIGDQVITLDANSNISADDATLLVDSVDLSKLRVLFNNLKDKVDLDKGLESVDRGLIEQGKSVYNGIVEEASPRLNDARTEDSFREAFISPMTALTRATNEQDKRALSAYIKSLDSTEVLQSGNFLEDMRDAYKLSPYTRDDLRGLLFRSNSAQLELFDQLTGIPGMETLRISVAITSKLAPNKPIDDVTGVYMTPDNIIQILVPQKYYEKPASTSPTANVDAANLTSQGYNKVRQIILHELAHSVFSEMYKTSSDFRKTINELKQHFVVESKKLNDAARNTLLLAYSDTNPRKDELKTHEFLADVFTNKRLQAALNATISKSKLYQGVGEGGLYTIFMSSLSNKYQVNNSLLRDVIAAAENSVPASTLMDSLQGSEQEYYDQATEHNMFFLRGANLRDIQAHTGFRDQTDTPWDTNSVAYWLQEQLKLRTADKNIMKEAFYEGSTRKPSDYEIELAQKQDLAITSWLEYEHSPVEGEWGEWVEVGVVVDKNKKPVQKDGKDLLAKITRDKDGAIVQDNQSGTIQARERSMPIVFVDRKNRRVTLAKTGLKSRTDQKYNTISVPYEMIKGIRKFDRTFFDHTHDYASDVKFVKAELDKAKKEEGEAKEDNTVYWSRVLEDTEANLEKAKEDKEQMMEDFREYAYTFTTEGKTKMNLTKSAYAQASFAEESKLNSREFAATPEEAVFTIGTFKKSGKSRSLPNPKRFAIIFDSDAASEFAKNAREFTEIAARGDMVEIPSKYDKIVNGKRQVADGTEWRHVYKRVANGVMVSTVNGEGYIVPFSRISGYAKNKGTQSYQVMTEKFVETLSEYKDKIFTPKAEKAKSPTLNTEFSKWNALKYNEDYYSDADDGEEATRVKFTKDKFDEKLERTKSYIEPLKSFVKLKRTYKSGDDVKEYESIELVVAKTDEGLLLMSEYEGDPKFDYVKYDDKLDAGQPWGAELLFAVEDYSKTKELYQEYLREKDIFKQNKDREKWEISGTDDNPIYKPAYNFDENPADMRDVYDVYENVSAYQISQLNQGDQVLVDITKDPEKPMSMWRKVVAVKKDGTVSVADNRPEDTKYGKAGIYNRYVKPVKILKVAYKLGAVEGDEESGYTSEFHQEIINRRNKILKNAERDLDKNDFFFMNGVSAQKFNAGGKYTDSYHDRYVPLTNRILEPKSTDEEVFLDRGLKPVSEDKAIWVKAKFNGDAYQWVYRGLNANSSFWKADDVLVYRGKKLVVAPEFTKQLMPGDWVVTQYRKKGTNEIKKWSSEIDRVEGGVVYKINDDRTSDPIALNRVVGFRTSVRNDRFSNFKRTDETKAIVKALKEAKEGTEKGKKGKLSLDLPFKSPNDSRKALYEIGERMTKINPDIKLNFVEQGDLDSIMKQTGHSYDDARAFVLGGQVFVNLQKASISDVVHEYAHLFLHNLKYENSAMYDALTSMASDHPLYEQVASAYPHLNKADLDEEVFVTLLGEHMKGRMENKQHSWFKDEKDTENIVNFADYTKSLLQRVMGGGSLSQIQPDELLNMQLEQVMHLVGDAIMLTRVSSMSDNALLESSADVDRLRKDLFERGLLTQECYG